MGIADKIKSSKDNRVKVKRIRFGNVKDFHGRRQHGENILVHEGIWQQLDHNHFPYSIGLWFWFCKVLYSNTARAYGSLKIIYFTIESSVEGPTVRVKPYLLVILN